MLEKTKQVIRSFPLRLVLRIGLGILFILVGVALLFLPGPGLVVIIAGLVVLGFTVDDIVDVCRKVIPGFDEQMAESILRHRFLRAFRRKKRAILDPPDAEGSEEDDHDPS